MIKWYTSLTCCTLLLLQAFLCEAEEQECVAGNEKNELTEDEKEIPLGLNALPVHIAAVMGQLTDIHKCGPWCVDATPTSACLMDTSIVPCEGDFYCTTTCALWNRFILSGPLRDINAGESKERPTATCAMFKRFDGFVTSEWAEFCDTSCLLPEIRPHRYPAPTGLGLFCQKGTCYPAISSLAELIPDIPANLECPCNWFGSDCSDDFLPIQKIEHTATYGDEQDNAVVSTTLTVSNENWYKIIDNHQPGGVIRLTHRDLYNTNTTNSDHVRVQEQPYALAFAPKEGKLQILTAPPDRSLHIVARAVAERVRSLPNGPVEGGNLYVNPSIAGFFNGQWTFLLPFLDTNPSMKHVVLMSTGAGLSGSVSAVQALQKRPQKIHMFHGVRRIKDLPFQDYLHQLTNQVSLMIVESQPPMDFKENDSWLPGITVAVKRGREMRQLLTNDSSGSSAGLDQGGKLYVQNAVHHELTKGELTLDNTVFVACGRLALLDESREMLTQNFCGNSENPYECSQQVGLHFFTNI